VVVVVVVVDASGVTAAEAEASVVVDVSVVVVLVSFFWQPIDRAATTTAKARILFMTLLLLKNQPFRGCT
jgi:uncharacterized membrane protein YtjA (UPF0391 family)